VCYLVEVDSADAVNGVSKMVLDVPSDVAAGKELESAVGKDEGDATSRCFVRVPEEARLCL